VNAQLWTTVCNSSRYEILITALTIGNNRYRKGGLDRRRLLQQENITVTKGDASVSLLWSGHSFHEFGAAVRAFEGEVDLCHAPMWVNVLLLAPKLCRLRTSSADSGRLRA
jgi:hypothetical protein